MDNSYHKISLGSIDAGGFLVTDGDNPPPAAPPVIPVLPASLFRRPITSWWCGVNFAINGICTGREMERTPRAMPHTFGRIATKTRPIARPGITWRIVAPCLIRSGRKSNGYATRA